MQKIVYFCPVDWRWIKQRPQFLAEQLQRYGEVSVIYPWRNRRKGLQKKMETTVRVHPYFALPTFGSSVPVVENFNHIIGKKQIAYRLRVEKPQILWLTMPWQIDLIPQNAGCRILALFYPVTWHLHLLRNMERSRKEKESGSWAFLCVGRWMARKNNSRFIAKQSQMLQWRTSMQMRIIGFAFWLFQQVALMTGM